MLNSMAEFSCGKNACRRMEKFKTSVIGISEATRSGKSNLADLLAKHYDLPSYCVLHQDKFWIHIKDRPQVSVNGKLKPNMETPLSVNWSLLISRLESLLNKGEFEFVIIEGFLLYTNQELMKLIDYPIFITISKEICFERRKKTKWASSEEFELLIWPEYVKNNLHVSQDNSILVLDGERSPNTLTQKVIDHINGNSITSYQKLLLEQCKDSKTKRKLDYVTLIHQILLIITINDS